MRRDRPLVGYGLVVAAAILASVNATVGKIVMTSGGLTPYRVSEVRAAGSAVLILVALALVRGRELRPRRDELPFLALFGLVGLAIAQLLYFISIRHLPIGVALVVVNLGIVLVAVWAHFFRDHRVDARLAAAICLALGGLALVVQLWKGLALNGVGIAAALACAIAYAAYILLAEHAVARGRSAAFIVGWGFLIGSAFWAVAQPWWSFPWELLGRDVSLLGRLGEAHAPVWLLLLYVVPLGTVAPFVLYAAALRYVPATHVVVAAVLEPVFGTLVAFAWLGETLGAAELLVGLLVLAAVVLGQTGGRVRVPEPLPGGARGGR